MIFDAPIEYCNQPLTGAYTEEEYKTCKNNNEIEKIEQTESLLNLKHNE